MKIPIPCGVINSPTIRNIVDGYAVETNRGTDVLKYLAIPKYDSTLLGHQEIARKSKEIHQFCKQQFQDNGKIDAVDFLPSLNRGDSFYKTVKPDRKNVPTGVNSGRESMDVAVAWKKC